VTFTLRGALLIALFAFITAIAQLTGAANLGTAAGIGQIGFAFAATALLLKR
jgi:hypothetical protein